MKEKDNIVLVISLLLWSIMLSGVIFIENSAQRLFSIFVGIIIVIAIIEIIRKMMGLNCPYIEAIFNFKNLRTTKEKFFFIAELISVPLIGTIVVSILLNITMMFFMLIGL